MAKILLLVASAIFVISCSSGPDQTPPERMKPSEQPSFSETAERLAATDAEVKALLDLPEYPGAKVVDNKKLVSNTLAPDEIRFELTRQSADAPSKVIAFYESKLGAKSTSDGDHREVFGRTNRGNFVRVHVEPEGNGSKISLSVISYAK
ncbi:MAG TPA: hypothetical protein VJ835_11415 [Fimbriimonadaceae bacterium]|nr:hypothetical protein [Fimbriimonadaceae bacterium]